MKLPVPIAKRRPVLAAVAALLIIGAAGVAQVRAQSEARHEAAVAEARVSYQEDLDLAYAALEGPTQRATLALSQLREILQQHLAAGDTSGQELAAQRTQAIDELRSLADQLRAAARAPTPLAPEILPPDGPASLVEQLRERREEAAALADAIGDAVGAAQRWVQELADLRVSAVRFVEAAESHPSTTEPAQLVAQWRAELAPLEDYGRAADDAARLPGLEPVAEAHRAYVDANLAWIDEAVALLESGQLDAYNARLDELFGAEDPFGFTAALSSATQEAFTLGALADLASTRDLAASLLDRIAESRRLAPILLRPADASGPPAG